MALILARSSLGCTDKEDRPAARARPLASMTRACYAVFPVA